MILRNMMDCNTLLDASNNVIIYGSGNYGKRLATLLEIKGFDRSKIQGFAVTKLNENDEKTWNGYKIREFWQYSDILSTCLVLIAMRPLYAQDVYYEIEKCGAKNVVLIENIFFQEAVDLFENEFCKKTLKNSIFFFCYAGRGFECNPKYIAKELLKSSRSYEILWEVRNEEIAKTLPKGIKPVLRDSLEYYEEIYTAKIIITNEEYDLRIRKRNNQVYIMTWHGAGPFKKIGIHVRDYSEENKKKVVDMFTNYDYCLSCNSFQEWQYRNAFLYKGCVLNYGYPRNDILVKPDINLKSKVCSKLHINPMKNGIVLYAPTFRNVGDKSIERYNIDAPRVLKSLRKRFGKEFILLYRFHYSLNHRFEKMNLINDGINVTSYPDMQELLLVSDVLITDYSSSMWDFSLQRRPVFLYHADYDLYINDRGFYCPPSEWPYIIGNNNNELCKCIEEYDDDEYQKKLDEWFKRYPSYDDGKSSSRVVQKVLGILNDEELSNYNTK